MIISGQISRCDRELQRINTKDSSGWNPFFTFAAQYIGFR